MSEIREQIVDCLDLFARASAQLQYEQALVGRHGHAPTELIEMYCSDLFHPSDPQFVAAFSETELVSLCILRGLIHRCDAPATVSELLKAPEWREVMSFSKELHETIERRSA